MERVISRAARGSFAATDEGGGTRIAMPSGRIKPPIDPDSAFNMGRVPVQLDPGNDPELRRSARGGSTENRTMIPFRESYGSARYLNMKDQKSAPRTGCQGTSHKGAASLAITAKGPPYCFNARRLSGIGCSCTRRIARTRKTRIMAAPIRGITAKSREI